MLRYFKSREFWLFIVGGSIFLAALVYILTFYVFLPNYTQHGESVIVPEVTEASMDEAIGLLEAEGLRYEVADSIFISNMKPAAIISQDPAGMSKVKPGRRIYLTVNKRVPPMVRIPEILNVSTYQAKLLLEGAGLKIKRITYIPDEYKNLVRYSEFDGKRIRPGDTLPKFSEVELFAGRGLGSQKTAIPDLVGMHYEEAISALHRDGLNIGPVRFDPEALDPKGTVIRQSPRYFPGDSTVIGANITLFIAGPEPEEELEFMNFEDDDEEEEEGDGEEESSEEDASGDENEEDNPSRVRTIRGDTGRGR